MRFKSSQIQIRVSAREQSALEALARSAGQSVSAYVLGRALPSAQLRFGELLGALADEGERRFVLAELNDLLAGLAPMELRDAVADADLGGLSPYLRNYVAAMVELAAERKGVAPPAWTRGVVSLEEPAFATDLAGLRLHLLRSPRSPSSGATSSSTPPSGTGFDSPAGHQPDQGRHPAAVRAAR